MAPRAQTTEDRWPEPAGAARGALRAGRHQRPARALVAQRLGEDLGQPSVAENRSGAQAILGTEAVARARPDGRTLLVGASGPVVFNPATSDRPPYDTLRDFVPISLLASSPLVLLIGRDAPVRSAAELGAGGSTSSP